MSPQPLPRGASPFDTTGVGRRADGIARYADLPSSLVEMLRRSVERDPDAEAVVEIGRTDCRARMTYRELWDAAARVAGGLGEAGIGRGDRVANLKPAGVDWVLGFLGTQLAGAVAVPVNTRFAEPEIDYVLRDSGAAVVLRPGEPLPDGPPKVAEDLGHDDLAAIFYTSGTTGFPKGAMTTQGNFLSNIETVIRVIGIGDDGAALRGLVSVPLFHVTGCNSQLLFYLTVGASTVILPVFDVQTFLRTVVDERITQLTSVPAIFALAMAQPNFGDFDLSAVSRIAYGGAPMAPELVGRLSDRFPNARLGNGFGLTETASLSTFLPHEWAASNADSVGFAVPVIDLALDSPDDAGVGELLIRGPNVVAGYWNKPEATAETFVDGWLHSGDLARVDDEGLVYIVDRAKDMINRGGENVYSVEVENALASVPGLAEAAVVGVPDEVMGEKVGAVLVPAPGATLEPSSVVSALRELLADFKVPQYLVVRSEPLPRNPGGKILKRKLREDTDWGKPLR